MGFRHENIRFADHIKVAPEVFSRPIIAVELRPETANNRGNRAAFLLALNLLSRMFERVYAVFPEGTEASRHPWCLKTIDAVINDLNDTVEGTISVGRPKHSDVVLSIGKQSSISASREVVVGGSSWCAALDCNLPERGEGVLGYLYSACLGAAQVLLHVLKSMNAAYQPMAPFSFSLLDLLQSGADHDVPQSVSIPETHLVGIGAVGSAAIYALAHLENVRGTLNLIDNEKLDDTNLNRYALMRRADLDCWKVDIACQTLEHTAIETVPYRGAFQCYVNEHGSDINLLLSPVDSKEGRRGLAKMLPRRVINAATGGTTVTVSTHGFNDGKACLHCLYPVTLDRASREEIMAKDMGLPPDKIIELVRSNAPVDAELAAQIEKNRGVKSGTWIDYIGSPISSFYVRAVCGEASLRMENANVIAPLSFISASAGVLLAAELIKASHPELSKWALDNYFRVDTLNIPNPVFRRVYPQDQSGRCICKDTDYIEVYSGKYGS